MAYAILVDNQKKQKRKSYRRANAVKMVLYSKRR